MVIVLIANHASVFAEDWKTLRAKVDSYYQQGQYEVAIEYAQKALIQAEKEFGKDNVYYADTQNYLALLYQNLEQYTKAEPLYLQSMKIFKIKLGEGHPYYGAAVFNLGNLYHTIGKYKDAEKMFKLAMAIYKQNYGDQDKEYARPTYNLAKLYFDMKEYKKAEKYFIEALLIYRKVYGAGHMSYITGVVELANLYKITNKFAKAESLYKELLQIYKQLYGEDTVEYAHALSNLAIVKDFLGKDIDAEKMLNQALAIYDKFYGQNHQYYIRTLQYLARVYDNLNDYDKSKDLWFRVLNIYLTKIKHYFPTFSEKEKGVFYNSVQPFFEEFNSFVYKWRTQHPELIGEMYNNQLETKALLLNATSKVRRRILNSGNQVLIDKFNEWIALKERLATFYTLSKERIEKSHIDIPSFENKANKIEKELSRESELFHKEFSKKRITWKNIQSTLKDKEAAIEIVRFRHFNHKWTDTVYYAALILNTNTTDNPDLVVIQNGNQLEDEYLHNYKNMIKHQLLDRDSYRAYWEKIQKELTNIKTLYISLDGVYTQINLLTVKFPDNKYLIDTFDINIVHNTRILAEDKIENVQNNKHFAELIGYPDYNYDKTKDKIAMLEKSNSNNIGKLELKPESPWDNFKIAKAKQDLKDVKVSELPGTEKEINDLSNILINNNWKVEKYLRKDASESSVKKVKSPTVLHIATHGYFLKDIENNPESSAFGVDTKHAMENPLLRSGLLFSGASLEIAGTKNEDINSNDNGILTAFEAMNLDLDNTELVVLSACETGLGEVKNGEGVYGLQRAFEVAGAKAIIMSLWTVNDYTTQELMRFFYQNWLKSGDKKQAFKKAQLEMKELYNSPYYWGAFVLITE